MFVGNKKRKTVPEGKLQPASPITSVQEATANALMEAFSATSSTRSSGTEVTWGELPVTAILAPGYGGKRNPGSKSKDLRNMPSHLPQSWCNRATCQRPHGGVQIANPTLFCLKLGYHSYTIGFPRHDQSLG